MSVWYYGIVYEDDEKIIVMYVGKGFDFPEDVLKEHIKYAKAVSEALETVEDNTPTTSIIKTLGKAAKSAEEAYTTELLVYLLLCLKMGVEPRIIDEYRLSSMSESGKKVIILGEDA